MAAFAAAHGTSLPSLLASVSEPRAAPKAAPSGCYTRIVWTRGMSALSGATTIWDSGGQDDESADVPIGFYFSFYGCKTNTGRVELHFGTLDADAADNATVGIEGPAGVDGDCGPSCANTQNSSSISFNYSFAPVGPSNDSCSKIFATCLGDAAPVATGNTFGAQGGIDGCGFGAHDLWLWYHAPVDRTVSFDTCAGAGFDTTLGVYASCNLATQILCNDDGCPMGPGSKVQVDMTGGEDYFVRLAGVLGVQGTYTVTSQVVNQSTAPQHETCATAQAITGFYTGTTVDNSGCIDESSCAVDDLVSEWLSWTAPQSGPATFTTCGTNTHFDTTLAIYDGCGGTELACNDEAAGASKCSRVSLNVLAGHTYRIRVAGAVLDYGPYQLSGGLALIFSDGFESGNVSKWSASVP